MRPPSPPANVASTPSNPASHTGHCTQPLLNQGKRTFSSFTHFSAQTLSHINKTPAQAKACNHSMMCLWRQCCLICPTRPESASHPRAGTQRIHLQVYTEHCSAVWIRGDPSPLSTSACLGCCKYALGCCVAIIILLYNMILLFKTEAPPATNMTHTHSVPA